MTKEDAETLLTKWGEWQQGNQNIGYSPINTIGRLIEQGGDGASQSTTPVIPDMDDDVQRVENALNDIKDKRTHKVIRGIYIYEMSIRGMASDYGITRDEIKIRLDACANFIAGRLSSFAA